MTMGDGGKGANKDRSDRAGMGDNVQGGGSYSAALREQYLSIDGNYSEGAGVVPPSSGLADSRDVSSASRVGGCVLVVISGGGLGASGMCPMKEYICRIQATIAEYITNRPIYKLRKGSERVSRSIRFMQWWYQDINQEEKSDRASKGEEREIGLNELYRGSSLTIYRKVGALLNTPWYPNLQVVEGELKNNNNRIFDRNSVECWGIWTYLDPTYLYIFMSHRNQPMPFLIFNHSFHHQSLNFDLFSQTRNMVQLLLLLLLSSLFLSGPVRAKYRGATFIPL